jgi:hypothetical protein
VFRFHFDRDRSARKTVTAMKAALRDLRWFWPHAVKGVARVHREHFDTEGHGAWYGLAEMTMHYRESRQGYYRSPGMGAPEGPILHWTWRLRDSLSDFHPSGTMMSVRRFHRKKMVYGTKHPVAYENHYGGENRDGRTVPPRPLLDVDGSLARVVEIARRVVPRHLRSL